MMVRVNHMLTLYLSIMDPGARRSTSPSPVMNASSKYCPSLARVRMGTVITKLRDEHIEKVATDCMSPSLPRVPGILLTELRPMRNYPSFLLASTTRMTSQLWNLTRVTVGQESLTGGGQRGLAAGRAAPVPPLVEAMLLLSEEEKEEDLLLPGGILRSPV